MHDIVEAEEHNHHISHHKVAFQAHFQKDDPKQKHRNA
jgi:hypothetical protein